MTTTPRSSFALVLLVLLLTGVSTAHAQTTTPDRSFIVLWMEDVIFPSGFYAALTTIHPDSDIVSAVFTLRQSDDYAQRIAVDLDAAVELSGENGQFAVYVPFTETAFPRLFAPLVYTWELTDVRGDTARIEQTHLFTDPRIEWTLDPGDDFTLIVPPSLNAAVLRAAVEPFYRLIGASSPFTAVLYPPDLAPGCASSEDDSPVAVSVRAGYEQPCDLALAAAIYDGSDLATLRLRTSDVYTAAEQVNTALADATLTTRWDDADVPAWFRTGFVQFFTPSRKAAQLAPALASVRGGAALSLAELSAQPEGDDALWRAQSLSLVLYLADTLGIDGVTALATGSAPFTDTYADLMNTSLAALPDDWARWLLTDRAVAAYNYAVYSASTATPSPVPSRTPTLRPSRTPTPTATFTPTATATVTFTPSPVPPTPTVTPRPANSLPTVTPTPTPVVSRTALPTGQLIVVVSAIILVALLIVLYIRLGRTP